MAAKRIEEEANDRNGPDRMAINLREIEIFKPYNNEFPESILTGEGATDACIEVWLESQTLRVAKIGATVLGCYAMDRNSTFEFQLHGVVVDPPVRKQGLGRWMVGHAIGVAESKGGRHLRLAEKRASRCFDHIGFIKSEAGWQFDLIQE